MHTYCWSSRAALIVIGLMLAGGCARSGAPGRGDASKPLRDMPTPARAAAAPRTPAPPPGGQADRARTSRPQASPARQSEHGVASYYAARYHGRPTASGERFDVRKMTAAHRTLPFGTRVRVTHLASGRSVAVRVNDRGPFVRGRVIDLSPAAAERLGMLRAGLADVRVDVLDRPATVAGVD